MSSAGAALRAATISRRRGASNQSGCLAWDLSGGTTNRSQCPTVGQQLIDLQKAKDAGIITDAEYQAQKAKLLGNM